MITVAQVRTVAAEIGFADLQQRELLLPALPQREFRFYAGDFITPVESDCLTATRFASRESRELVRAWTTACFCHCENLSQSWLGFRETLVQDFQFQQIGIFEFRIALSQWIERLNPELELALSELRDISARAHTSFAVSSGAGLHSVIGVAPEFCAVLVWNEATRG